MDERTDGRTNGRTKELRTKGPKVHRRGASDERRRTEFNDISEIDRRGTKDEGRGTKVRCDLFEKWNDEGRATSDERRKLDEIHFER